MIIDSSALVAIMRREAEEEAFKAAVAHATCRVSAVTALETAIVVGPERHEDLDELLAQAGIKVAPFDGAQVRLAREAYARFGKGSGSRARLNFGDCVSYALAKVTGEPLLFKGDAFTHTDIEAAYFPDAK